MVGVGYTVKNIETIAESRDMRARLYTLALDDCHPVALSQPPEKAPTVSSGVAPTLPLRRRRTPKNPET
jgi:hypothetical protein